MVPDRVRLPFVFDVGRLRADLERLADVEWVEHFVRQNYEGDWDVLPLRGPAGETHPIRMSYSDPTATAFEDTPFLAATDYLPEVLATFVCPLRSVRLMRLTPGSRIREHDDLDLDADHGTARIHVPITTNADVEFLLNGTPVVMAPGSCWYLRLSDPHAVRNDGTTDRVHLVLDADVDDWLRAALAAAG